MLLLCGRVDRKSAKLSLNFPLFVLRNTVVGNMDIRNTFRLFSEENFLHNYRGNIQVPFHISPHDFSLWLVKRYYE